MHVFAHCPVNSPWAYENCGTSTDRSQVKVWSKESNGWKSCSRYHPRSSLLLSFFRVILLSTSFSHFLLTEMQWSGRVHLDGSAGYGFIKCEHSNSSWGSRVVLKKKKKSYPRIPAVAQLLKNPTSAVQVTMEVQVRFPSPGGSGLQSPALL